MGSKSGISFCDSSFSPWIGCTKYENSCKNCWAKKIMDPTVAKWGPTETRVPTKTRKTGLFKYQEQAGSFVQCANCGWRGSKYHKPACPECGNAECFPVRQRVFVGHLCDLLEDRRDLDEWRADIFSDMEKCPDIDIIVCSHRTENHMLWPVHWRTKWPKNVWVMASAGTQDEAEKRWVGLKEIPAPIKGFILEPMIGPVILTDFIEEIQWVIGGFESGENRREGEVVWMHDVAKQCKLWEVPFFCKQDGAFRPEQQGRFENWLWQMKSYPVTPQGE